MHIFAHISKKELVWGSRLTVSDQIRGQANMSKLVNTNGIKKLSLKASSILQIPLSVLLGFLRTAF